MLRSRPRWWMYVIAAVYVLTFLFNARQEFWGPANAGWVPSWPTFRVAAIVPGTPMDKAGLRAGDVLETVNGQPLNAMPDWFLARAHFQRNHPIELRIRRGDQQLGLQFEITTPAWRSGNRAHYVGTIAFYTARFTLLLLAILVGFCRPEQLSARIAALMLAIGSVAEGYPSAGWASALRHLPAVLAIPICLATASCLLSAQVWLAFFAGFPRPWLSQRWRWSFVFVPLLIFGVPIAASAIAMIYLPSALVRPWPLVLSAAPVRLIQSDAGVVPLLFLNVWPLSRPVAQVILLELWLAVSLLYFVAGFLMLVANYRRLDDPSERRRIGTLCLALVFFFAIVVHNFFARNWMTWFGSSPPALFSGPATAGATVLFLFVPLALAYSVLAEGRRERNQPSAESSASTKQPAVKTPNLRIDQQDQRDGG